MNKVDTYKQSLLKIIKDEEIEQKIKLYDFDRESENDGPILTYIGYFGCLLTLLLAYLEAFSLLFPILVISILMVIIGFLIPKKFSLNDLYFDMIITKNYVCLIYNSGEIKNTYNRNEIESISCVDNVKCNLHENWEVCIKFKNNTSKLFRSYGCVGGA